MGFLYASGSRYKYFFHRKAGIRRETLGGFIKEIFEFENYVHLCLEDAAVPKFINLIEKSHEKIGIIIKSEKKIQSAYFSFSFEIYRREFADEVLSIFSSVNENISLTNYKPKEKQSKDNISIGGYAPAPLYLLKGAGKAEGEFLDIMELFLKIKRSRVVNCIISSEVYLNH